MCAKLALGISSPTLLAPHKLPMVFLPKSLSLRIPCPGIKLPPTLVTAKGIGVGSCKGYCH